MKKILFILLSLFVINACKFSKQQEKDVSISAYITGYFDGDVVLYKVRKGELTAVDSLHMKKSKFKFKHVKINSPEMFWLNIDKGNFIIQFFADPHDMQINADYKNKNNLDIQGSETNNEYISFLENNTIYENKQMKINEQKEIAFEQNDSQLLNTLDSELDSVSVEQTEFIKKYAYENNKSFVSLYLTLSTLSNQLTLSQLERTVNHFADTLKQSAYYHELKDLINKKKNIQPGLQAPDFSIQDSSGTLISLSSLQGKIVLLSFSASWNGTCRVDNKELKNIYDKYQSAGFEIYQISIENNKQQWKNVIRADRINWIIVSDLKGLDSEILQLYTVSKIPQYFLLDKNGIIIKSGNDLREIRNHLSKLL